MGLETLRDFAILSTLAVQFGGTIWWASKLTAVTNNLVEAVKDLRADHKDHVEDDRQFQLDIVNRLNGSTNIKR